MKYKQLSQNMTENPFPEEFDPKDVVNKKPKTEPKPKIDVDTLDNYNEESVKDEKFSYDFNKAEADKNNIANDPAKFDLDTLDNYNEEDVQQKHFHFEYESEDFTEEDERLQQGFKDFLIARKISGREHGYADANRIPGDKLIQHGEIVEINDDPRIEDEATHNASTVVVHRNEAGEIVFLDVICSCGRNTLIKLDFENTIEKDDVELSHVNYSEAADNSMLTMGNHTYSEPAPAVDETQEYSDTLLDMLDNIDPDANSDEIKDEDIPSAREANIIDELNSIEEDVDEENFDNFDDNNFKSGKSKEPSAKIKIAEDSDSEDDTLLEEFNELLNDD